MSTEQTSPVYKHRETKVPGAKKYQPYVYWLLLIIALGLWGVLYYIRQPKDGLGTDFYPLYRAGQALLAGQNPYGPALTAELSQSWHVPYASAGFAYPLPAVIGIWPIVLLPLPVAILVWVLAGTLGSGAAIALRDDWRKLLLLPVCFMPLHNAAIMKQATLVWFALVAVLLFAMRREKAWLVGLCVALLPAKPQAGIFFAIAGLIWAWQGRRRALLWIAAWATLIWGGSFLLQPGWIDDWIASVMRYNQIVYTASLWPWGLLLIATTWKLPWYARLGAAQALLFPITDAYSVLPLLLVWVGIGGPLAVLGAAISWLGVLAGLPNNLIVLATVVVIPAILCSAWQWYRQPRVRMAQ